MEFSELKQEIERLKKQYNDLQNMITEIESNQSLNEAELEYLESLKTLRNETKSQLEELGIVVTTEIAYVEREFNIPKYKELSERELELLEMCKEKAYELDSFKYLDEELEDFLDKAIQIIERVENKENLKNREEGLELLYNQLCAAIEKAKELNKKELSIFTKATNKTKEFFKKHWKKLVAGVLVGGILIGGVKACDVDKDKEENIDEDDTKRTEMIIDQESYEYFINKGVRESDAKELAENSAEIDNLLEENNVTDIKTNDVDEMLYDVYEGHNITSSAENYDSLDTYTSLENVATTDVFNNLVGVPGYETIDYDKCGNILGFVNYLDINDGSAFDVCMERLSEAGQNFFANVNSKEAAQNFIDVIYDVNKKSGELNASEEGLITEYIMAVGPTLSILYPDLTVTGTKININDLIDHIVAEIEVFEQDSCYTRTLN